MYPLYQLITYNRRVIAGSKAPKKGFDCAPDFHLGYRLLYLFLSIGLSIGMLTKSGALSYQLGANSLAWGILTFGLIGLGGIFISIFNKDSWNMLGNSSTAFLMGAFPIWIGSWFGAEVLDISLWGGLILGTALMWREWYRRLII